MDSRENSRLHNSVFNIIWSIVSNAILALSGIASRAIFVRMLGDELMGVNSLFSDVLMLFSFAELGFGTAITFSLYKPVADDNKEKIKSLLVFYRNIHYATAAAIAAIGIGFVPFLDYLKTAIPLKDLTVYYAVFLLNNIISYIAAYRESYISVKQQARKLVVINTGFSLLTTMLQIVIVLLTKNFVLYLVSNTGLMVIRKVFVNRYILRMYPETDIRGVKSVEKEERQGIISKVKALAVHKVANLAISQTDSLIVSYMINVTQWGLVSNYLSLKATVTSITWQIYSALKPSMGDLVARESKEAQLNTFYVYDFISAWMFSFFFIALAVLSSPFVHIVYGSTRVVDNLTVFLLFFNVFFSGLREPVTMLKEVNGIFERDAKYTVISSAVNLVTSLIFVKLIGLPGVFLGTICSTVVTLVARPAVTFKQAYNVSSSKYFTRTLIYIFVTLAEYFVVLYAVSAIDNLLGLTVFSFVLMALITAVLPNAIWLMVFHKDKYCNQAFGIFLGFAKSYLTRIRKEK